MRLYREVFGGGGGGGGGRRQALVYRTRPCLSARVVPRSIILSACGAEAREGLADVIGIHNRLTNQILLSRIGKQLVHNFERARSTSGSTPVALSLA